MRTQPDIAALARIIGEPARAAILTALLGGEWLTAGELARAAGIAPPTASEHLGRLVAAGLIVDRRSGRCRYFALAGIEVAAMLESLAHFAGRPDVDPRGPTRIDDSLRFARSCYDHLAGRLGVEIAEALRARGLVAGAALDVTERGESELRRLGVDVESLRTGPRPLTRACLDWSERRDHLAGAVGAALLTGMLDRGWLARVGGSRALRLTLRGREGLYRTLGLELSSLASAARAEGAAAPASAPPRDQLRESPGRCGTSGASSEAPGAGQ